MKNNLLSMSVVLVAVLFFSFISFSSDDLKPVNHEPVAAAPKYRVIMVWIKDAQKYEEYMSKFPPIAKKYGYVMERMVMPNEISFGGVKENPFEKPDRIIIDYFNSDKGEISIGSDPEFKKIEPLLPQGVKRVIVVEGKVLDGKYDAKNKDKFYSIEMMYFDKANSSGYKNVQKTYSPVKSKFGYQVERTIEPSQGLGITKPDLINISYFDDEKKYKDFKNDAKGKSYVKDFNDAVGKSIVITGNGMQ